jgi:hypothetical protein
MPGRERSRDADTDSTRRLAQPGCVFSLGRTMHASVAHPERCRLAALAAPSRPGYLVAVGYMDPATGHRARRRSAFATRCSPWR